MTNLILLIIPQNSKLKEGFEDLSALWLEYTFKIYCKG